MVDGIQQGENGTMARTTLENEEDWNAVVTNETGKAMTFMPLDHNIVIHPTPDTTYSLCDGMLYESNKDFLAFIELKVRKESWMNEAVTQLRSTIELFSENHDISEYRKRVAYAANKKHPRFNSSHKEIMQNFRNDTKFRLLIQNNIEVAP